MPSCWTWKDLKSEVFRPAAKNMKFIPIAFFIFIAGRVFAADFPVPSAAEEAGSPSGGKTYLVESQDPDFLKILQKISITTYKSGRTMLVSLTLPYDELSPEIRSNLRAAGMNEVYSSPSGLRVVEEARPEVRALIAKVSGAQMKNYAESIVYTGKRSISQLDVKNGSGNKLAMDAVADAFKEIGLTVERHCYRDHKFDKECNIVGNRDGLSPDAKAILIIGHLDSVGYENAGADDNASGVAGVLEMARVLAGYKSDHAFIFAAVNGEENGIAGGYAYAAELKNTGLIKKIAWVINMDMISWNKDGVVELETNKEYLAHAEWVSALARTYTSLEPHIAMPAWGSDHVPFLDAGIPTYLSIEHWETRNPCYHKACDVLLEPLSWSYAAEIVKLNLAVAAGKAKLSPVN
jgi:hypothetical protein